MSGPPQPTPSCWPRSRRCPRPTTRPRSRSPRPPPPTPASPWAACSSRSGRPLLAFLLLALDAAAGLVVPILIRHGIDDGVSKAAPGRRGRRLADRAGGRPAADWLVQGAENQVSGRTGERVLYTLRLKIFAQLNAAGPGLLRARALRPDHDPDDHRRRRPVDVPADRRGAGVVSLLTFFGIFVALLVIDVGPGADRVRVLPVLVVATLVFRDKSSQAIPGPREGVGTVNADLQENVAGMRVTQAFRREEDNTARFVRAVGRRTASPGSARRGTSPRTSRSCSSSPTSPGCWCWSAAPRGSTPGR